MLAKLYDDEIKVKQAERTFNSDGYKSVRVLAFRDETVTNLMHKMGTVGLVVSLAGLMRLDYSSNNGHSFKIECADQAFVLGHSEELSFCKGAPKCNQVNNLPVLSLGNHLQCNRFINKNVDKACSTHQFMLAEHQMTQIRSSRASLHSDFIDLNKARKQVLLEQQE